MIRFLDTNALFYSVSTDRDEKAKREVATELLAERDNALSVQVLQEFTCRLRAPPAVTPAP